MDSQLNFRFEPFFLVLVTKKLAQDHLFCKATKLVYRKQM